MNIELHRSRLLVFLLFLAHGTATICCWLLPWPLTWRSVVQLLVVLSLVRVLRPPRIVGLRLASRNRLDCRLADGRLVAARVLPDSTVFARLVVLRLRLDEEGKDGSRCSLVILPDQLDAQEFRRLRACLRWQAQPDAKAGDDGPAA